MLGAFVRNGLSQRRIESEVLFQIIAGSDTTATGLRATILYLITAPRVMEKLRAEIDAAEAAGIFRTRFKMLRQRGSRSSGLYKGRLAHASAVHGSSDEEGSPWW